MFKMLNLLGVKKGLIEVIAYEGQKGKKNRHYWKIKCQCGGEKVVLDSYILNGGLEINCGCVAKRRNAEKNAERSRKKRKLTIEDLEGQDEFDALKSILIYTNANLKQAKELYREWRYLYTRRYSVNLEELLIKYGIGRN